MAKLDVQETIGFASFAYKVIQKSKCKKNAKVKSTGKKLKVVIYKSLLNFKLHFCLLNFNS